MSNPPIDPRNWSSDNSLKRFLIFGMPFLLILCIVIGLMVKEGHPIFKRMRGNDMAYMPLDEDGQGSIGKANLLFAELLKLSNDTVVACDLDALNRRYPAFQFAMPYPNTAFSSTLVIADEEGVVQKQLTQDVAQYVSDLRLVGICVDSIHDPELRAFYVNSDLPRLLSQQSEHLAEKYFRIRGRMTPGTRNKARCNTYEITSVEAIASQKRVSLMKDPWHGVILAPENCLFPSSRYVYIVIGNTVLPIPCDIPYNPHLNTFRVSLPDCHVTDANGGEIDYYAYAKSFQAARPCSGISFEFPLSSGQRNPSLVLHADRTGGGDQAIKIRLRGKSLITYDVYSPASGYHSYQDSDNAGIVDHEVKFESGMKVVVSASNGSGSRDKVIEFSIFKQNPLRILSSRINTYKGLSRYTISQQSTDLATQQLVRSLSLHLPNESCPVDTVRATVDPLLSHEFEREIKQYVAGLKKTFPGRYEMSVTIMDMANGHVLATPFYSDDINRLAPELRLTRKNPALVRRSIGSVFKPLMALAAVETNHSLIGLDTRRSGAYHLIGKDVASFFGKTTTDWGSSSMWNGTDMSNFLGYSDDVYPVALAALSMAGYSDHSNLTGENNLNPRLGQPGSIFARNDQQFRLTIPNGYSSFNDVELLATIDRLYNIVSDYSEHESDRSRNAFWQNVYTRHNGEDVTGEGYFALDDITPECTNMHYSQWVEPYSLTLRQGLVPWVLGQANNQWNCVKVAEAWTRMMTKQPLNAVFVAADSAVTPVPARISLVHQITDSLKIGRGFDPQDNHDRVDAMWDQMLDCLQAAQRVQGWGATLHPMYEAVQRLNRNRGLANDNALLLFSKTGTPAVYSQYEMQEIGGRVKYIDMGLYTFSLLSQGRYRALKQYGAADGFVTPGITCVVRIVRITDDKPKSDGIESSHARNFFSANDSRLNKLYDMTSRYYRK